jgi:SAM-dependent MidA family methyltransferase
VVESLAEVGAGARGVIVANELVDNLPMAITQLTDAGWRERWVGLDGEALTFVDADPRAEVGAWLAAHAGEVPVGGWVEVQLAAGEWLREAVGGLQAGSVVLFDYGDTKENLVPRRQDGTLRTYRSHHLGPHPLDEPGVTDITADVNFSALEAAVPPGAVVTVMRQDDWLGEWGLRSRVSEMRHRELELARSGEEAERLRIRTLRTDAEALLHPRGLGDFRVLVATVG